MKRYTIQLHRGSTLVTAIGGLISACALVFIIAGCAQRETEAVVTHRDIIAYHTLDGDVAAPASAQANILAPYDAPVAKILVTVGQAVRRGDVLMQLSAPRSEAYYREARQRLQQARNQLAQAEKSYRAEMENANRELAQARAAEKKARQSAQVTVDTPDVTIIETDNPELADAIARRRAAEQAVLDIRAIMEENLAPYRQQVFIAQQEFQDAQSGLKAAMIRTPISGTILDINAETGAVVTRDTRKPVARVVDLDALKVYASVDEEDLDLVETEAPATITVKELPKEEFQGSVNQVYSEKAGFLRGTKHVAVIDFRNKEGEAKPGMDATASVKIGEARNVPAVPVEAVYEVNDKHTVKVRQDNEWRERVVEVGLSDGKYIEIQSGLEEEDTVLLNP